MGSLQEGKESLAHRTGDLNLKAILNLPGLQHMNTAMVFSIQYRIRSSVTAFYTEDLGEISCHLIKLSLVLTLMTKYLVDNLPVYVK